MFSLHLAVSLRSASGQEKCRCACHDHGSHLSQHVYHPSQTTRTYRSFATVVSHSLRPSAGNDKHHTLVFDRMMLQLQVFIRVFQLVHILEVKYGSWPSPTLESFFKTYDFIDIYPERTSDTAVSEHDIYHSLFSDVSQFHGQLRTFLALPTKYGREIL